MYAIRSYYVEVVAEAEVDGVKVCGAQCRQAELATPQVHLQHDTVSRPEVEADLALRELVLVARRVEVLVAGVEAPPVGDAEARLDVPARLLVGAGGFDGVAVELPVRIVSGE